MPTGYTAKLYEGESQDFADFTLQCARAFGATIMQRDEAADVPPKLRQESTYYAEKALEAERRLAEVSAWTEADWRREAAASNERTREARRKGAEKRAAIRVRYEEMLTHVLAWVPPSAEHVGLRDFMANQLRESIKFDCGDVLDGFYSQQTVEEFRASTLEKAARDVTYYADEQAKERERVATANGWIVALYESLGLPAPVSP